MSKVNGNKISKKNQLHDFLDYPLDNLVFADATEGSVPNSNPPVKFFRINVLAQNAELKEVEDEDGNVSDVPVWTDVVKNEKGVVTKEPEMVMSKTMGDALFTLDRMFSFGVSESTDPATGKVTGHSISLCLYSKDGATEREIRAVDKLEDLIRRCKEHLLSVCKTVKQPKMEMSDLKKMDKMLYWKVDDNGDRIPGVGPTLSPKLIEFKASVDDKGVERPYQMVTTFYLEDEVDEEGNPRQVDPLTFLSDNKNKKFKLCYVRPVIKIDSIFVGAKISIQCKITEADIAAVQGGQQRLLHGRHKVKEHSKTVYSSAAGSGVNPLLGDFSAAKKKDAVAEEEEEAELKEEDEPHKEEPVVLKKKILKKKAVATE